MGDYTEERERIYQEYCNLFAREMKSAKTYRQLYSAFMQNTCVREYVANFMYKLGAPREMRFTFVEGDDIYSDFHVTILVTCELLLFPKFQTWMRFELQEQGVVVTAPEISKEKICIVLDNAWSIISNNRQENQNIA